MFLVLNLTMLTITINVNGLNTQIKKETLKNQRAGCSYTLSKIDILNIMTDKLKVKR